MGVLVVKNVRVSIFKGIWLFIPYHSRILSRFEDSSSDTSISSPPIFQINSVVDSYETAQLRVQQMMKDSDIGAQEKKAKIFNEWERNKHFPEKIANNLKFLNNLQPEWKRHITIVRQTKDLHEVVQNAIQNLGIQNVGNQNGLIVVSGIPNPNANQNRNGIVVTTRVE
ncbi:hypothetical protein Tco_0753488, partial [Tanacetum coccineum]